MSLPSPLRFRMLHGLILVAGIAGCLSMRRTATGYYYELRVMIQEWHAGHSILLALSRVPKLVSESAPWMAAWTLTFLAMNLCPPRPQLKALIRQPGFVALFAASFPIMMVVGLDGIDRLASHWIFRGSIYLPAARRPFDVEDLLQVQGRYPATRWVRPGLYWRWDDAGGGPGVESRSPGGSSASTGWA